MSGGPSSGHLCNISCQLLLLEKMPSTKVSVFFFFFGLTKRWLFACLMTPTQKNLRIEPGVLGNASYAIRAVGAA